jgi:hypothetical protein
MSDAENTDVNVSVSLPQPPAQAEKPRDLYDRVEEKARSEITSNTELEKVKEILKSSRDVDALEDKSSFYPLQQKTTYMSPVCTLSSESKRIIRQAQAPILQASPRVVHFLYEV